MSLIQGIKSTAKTPVTTPDTLVNRAKANWNSRKVEILASASAAALSGGAIAVATTIWSGPFALIVGLATAALAAVASFFKALLSKQTLAKPVTPIDTSKNIVDKTKDLLKKAGNTLYNNKGKIALGAAALATGYGAYAYSSEIAAATTAAGIKLGVLGTHGPQTIAEFNAANACAATGIAGFVNSTTAAIASAATTAKNMFNSAVFGELNAYSCSKLDPSQVTAKNFCDSIGTVKVLKEAPRKFPTLVEFCRGRDPMLVCGQEYLKSISRV